MDVTTTVDRRDFFKIAGAGVAAASMLTAREAQAAQEAMQKAALDRIASNSYPIRSCFKTRPVANARQSRGGRGPRRDERRGCRLRLESQREARPSPSPKRPPPRAHRT